MASFTRDGIFKQMNNDGIQEKLPPPSPYCQIDQLGVSLSMHVRAITAMKHWRVFPRFTLP